MGPLSFSPLYPSSKRSLGLLQACVVSPSTVDVARARVIEDWKGKLPLPSYWWYWRKLSFLISFFFFAFFPFSLLIFISFFRWDNGNWWWWWWWLLTKFMFSYQHSSIFLCQCIPFLSCFFSSPFYHVMHLIKNSKSPEKRWSYLSISWPKKSIDLIDQMNPTAGSC